MLRCQRIKVFVILITISLLHLYADVVFEEDVEKFGDKLKDFSKNVMGADFLQAHYNQVSFKRNVSAVSKAKESLDEFVNILKENAETAKAAVTKLEAYIEEDYKNNKNNARKVKDCCTYNTRLKWDNLFQDEVNLQDVCETFMNRTGCENSISTLQDIHLLKEDTTIIEFKEAHSKFGNRARHSYFGGEDGYFIQYPAQNFMGNNLDHCSCSANDGRLRPWYVGAISPKEGKDIVLAIDVSSRMRGVSALLKEVVDVLLRTVYTNDKIRVSIYRSGEGGDDILDCDGGLVKATPAVITKITTAIRNLASVTFSGGFNYVNAIESSYKYLKQSERLKVIYMINSGEGLEKKDDIVKVIGEQAKIANCSVALKLFVVTDKRLDSQTHENQRKYLKASCSCLGCPEYKEENELVIFSTDDIHNIRTKLGSITTSLSGEEEEGTMYFSMPYFDINGLGTAIDACRRCSVDGRIVGVTCVMFLAEELFGLTYSFEQTEDLYSFLIDDHGTTYVHPKFPKLLEKEDKAFPLDIRTFETSAKFEAIYHSMLRGENGKEVIYENVALPTGAKFGGRNMTYVWKKVPNSPFSIAVAISSDYEEVGINVGHSQNRTNETYHRLDLYNVRENICTVKDKPATTYSSTLKLANTVFENPKSYFKDETLSEITILMNYMQRKSDTYSPIRGTNTALEIQENAIVTSVMNDFWKNNSQSESLYAIWRYVGTEDGTTRFYPGTTVHPYYDPRIRGWYRSAKASDGMLVLTEPYVDAWTGTILATLTQTIYKNTQWRSVAGVIGVDLSISYIQSVLFKLVSDCGNRNSVFVCVVLNRMGYMIYHPDFIENESPTKIHIIEKESATAEELIRAGHMKKKFCLGYHKTTDSQKASIAHIEWFYSLDNVSEKILQIAPVDPCPHYELVPVKNMNILVLKIKKQCSGAGSGKKCSCPQDTLKTCTISTVTDLEICECPCYQYRVCLDKLPPLATTLICDPPVKQVNTSENLYTTTWFDDVKKTPLPDCLDPKCKVSDSSILCNRLGCEWCFMHKNGSLFDDEDKYCNYEGKCFPEETTTASPTTTVPANTTTAGTKNGDGGLKSEIVIVTIVVVIIVLFVVGAAIKWYCSRTTKPPRLNNNTTMKDRHPSMKKDGYKWEEEHQA